MNYIWAGLRFYTLVLSQENISRHYTVQYNMSPNDKST